jgi:hypothetical protein
MNPGKCLFTGCDGTRKPIEVPLEEDSENPQATIDFEWQLTFEFLGSPNATKWIDGIGFVKKNGWDYMHQLRRTVDYPQEIVKLENRPDDIDPALTGQIIYLNEQFDADNPDSNSPPPAPEPTTTDKIQKFTITAPMAVYVEQVYQYADFRVLGIGF